MLARTITAVLSLLHLSSPALAHEFWLEPGAFLAEPGSVVTVTMRHGERFLGDPVPRDPAVVERFELAGPAGVSPVVGRSGAAVGFARTTASGMHVIGYRSRRMPNDLDAHDFEAYLNEEGLASIVAARAARGESTAPGREVYSRCAKTLVAVGDGGPAGGHDHLLGHALEIVPLQDPRTLSPGEALTLRVLYEGKPLAGASVVAARKGNPEKLTRLGTDAHGRVAFQLDHADAWMFTTIHMVRAPNDVDADWESFWSSLVLAVD